MGHRRTLNGKKIIYRAAVLAVLLAALALLAYLAPTLAKPEYLPADDFGHFWAAGRLNAQGQDPYQPEAILELLYQVGRPAETSGAVSVMLNPPWTLPLVMPFGLLDYPLSRLAWLMLTIAVMIVCTEQVWQLYGGDSQKRWIAWVLMIGFAPTVSVLQKGQFTPLILLGLILFTRWQRQPQHAWLAGAALALAAIKPQLVYLFWAVFLLWSLQTRNWKILLGCGLTLVTATLAAMLTNPQVLLQYQQSMGRFPLSEWATPTLGTYLRLLIGLEQFWLQFAPMLAGLAWLFFYWRKHRHNWDWSEQLAPVLLGSLLTAPYYWTYDLVLLVPAVLLAGLCLLRQPRSLRSGLLWLAYAAISLLDLLLHRRLDESWFGWVAPAVVLWYLAVFHFSPNTPATSAQEKPAV